MIMKVGRIKKTLKKVSRKRGVVFFVDGKTADVQKIMDKITYIKEILEEIGGISVSYTHLTLPTN